MVVLETEKLYWGNHELFRWHFYLGKECPWISKQPAAGICGFSKPWLLGSAHLTLLPVRVSSFLIKVVLVSFLQFGTVQMLNKCLLNEWKKQ